MRLLLLTQLQLFTLFIQTIQPQQSQQQPYQQQQQKPHQQLNSFINQLKSKTCPAGIVKVKKDIPTTTTTNDQQLNKLLSFTEWRNQSNNQSINQPIKPFKSSSLTCQPSQYPTNNLSQPNQHQKQKHQSSITHTILNQYHPPILYHPHPNTGTGSIDDPLKILSTRTNYASFDCSASIHRSSKQTKSPSAILNEKKDKYLLTPCTTSTTKSKKDHQPNHVVFELCDEIEIDHVVLANFEFFSSMFKLIKMSVSNSGLEGVAQAEWVQVGYLKTHNTRGFQVFPIEHLKGFYRYVRLDFLTHYGSEYYCPLSLVRIYGLTQIDAYRRDEKLEQRSKVKDQSPEQQQQEQVAENEQQYVQQAQSLPNLHTTEPLPSSHPETVTTTTSIDQNQNQSIPQAEQVTHNHPPVDPPSLTVQESYNQTLPSSKVEMDTSQDQSEPDQENIHPPKTLEASGLVDQLQQVEPNINQESPTNQDSEPASILKPEPLIDNSPSSDETDPSTLPATNDPHQSEDDSFVTTNTQHPPLSHEPELSSPPNSSNHPPHTTQLPEPALLSQVEPTNPTPIGPDPIHPNNPIIDLSQIIQPEKIAYHHTPSPGNPTGQGSESIFGQIMKRLNSLESNHLLLLKYTEDQVHVMGSSSHKLDLRLKELEKTLKLQAKKHDETIQEIQGIKSQMMTERNFVNHRIESLDSSITFIKRIGLVQFISILVVLVFLSMTRLQHGTSTPIGRREERRAINARSAQQSVRRGSSPRLYDHPSLRQQRSPLSKKVVPRGGGSPSGGKVEQLFLVSSLHRKLGHTPPRLPSLKLAVGSSRPSSPLRRSASLSQQNNNPALDSPCLRTTSAIGSELDEISTALNHKTHQAQQRVDETWIKDENDSHLYHHHPCSQSSRAGSAPPTFLPPQTSSSSEKPSAISDSSLPDIPLPPSYRSSVSHNFSPSTSTTTSTSNPNLLSHKSPPLLTPSPNQDLPLESLP